jgi:DNA invertase Pin-like site-specific DNA recombinase
MRLEQAGAIKVFTDDVGEKHGSPRSGRTHGLCAQGRHLAVVRLDRLGRSLAELLTTVEGCARRASLLSLEEKIDTSSAAGELIFHVFGPSLILSAG